MRLYLALAFINLTWGLDGPGCGTNCGNWSQSSNHYVKGDCVIYKSDTYCASWWTSSVPGTDGSWKKKIVTTTRKPRPSGPASTLPPTGNKVIDALVEKLKEVDSEGVFLYETPELKWEPSTVYKWEDMIAAVQIMADQGIGKMKLFAGEEGNFEYGMVNVAAFLAQCMQETIRYDACDENNWSDSKVAAKYGGSVYPASSACGQLGQSYQNYPCNDEEVPDMACEVDPDMEIRAKTRAKWYGAPPELFCAPRSKTGPTGQWAISGSWCAPDTFGDYISPYAPLDEYLSYMNNGGTCRDYENQKDGHWKSCGSEGCANLPAPQQDQPEGRTDVEGCCWWGRGVIQTTGVCNFGKLNYYMGERAEKRGADALYPEINFCKDPEVICRDDGPSELKWIAGLFYWLESVQDWDDGDFVYMDTLKTWVDNGMDLNDFSLVDAASGIVNRGCPKTECPAGKVHALQERRDNFVKVMEAMSKVFGTPTKKPVVTKKPESTPKPKTCIETCAGYCHDEECRSFVGEGERCSGSVDIRCASGLRCHYEADESGMVPAGSDGVCVSTSTPKPKACADTCPGYCHFEECRSFAGEGEACSGSVNIRCASGLTCHYTPDESGMVAPGSEGICKSANQADTVKPTATPIKCESGVYQSLGFDYTDEQCTRLCSTGGAKCSEFCECKREVAMASAGVLSIVGTALMLVLF